MARADLTPYQNPDLAPPDPDSLNLAAQIGAALNGQKSDPLLAQVRAGLESSPAGTLAAAEDAFKRQTQTTAPPTDWS